MYACAVQVCLYVSPKRQAWSGHPARGLIKNDGTFDQKLRAAAAFVADLVQPRVAKL